MKKVSIVLAVLLVAALIFGGVELSQKGSLQNTLNSAQEEVKSVKSQLETKVKEWASAGYTAPRVIFWNLDARQHNIPAIGPGFSYCSGFSMSALEGVLSGKDGVEMMRTVLEGERYAPISSVL